MVDNYRFQRSQYTKPRADSFIRIILAGVVSLITAVSAKAAPELDSTQTTQPEVVQQQAAPLAPAPSDLVRNHVPTPPPDRLQNDLLTQRVQVLFQRLYPEYRLSEGDLPPSSNAGRETILNFVSQLDSDKISAPGSIIRIVIENSEMPGAYSLPAVNESEPAEIRLSRGLANLLTTDSELAFVLGHELTHIRYDQFRPGVPALLLTAEQLTRINEVHQGWEFSADHDATLALKEAGLDVEAGRAVLERLANFEVSRIDSHDNSAAAYRSHPAIADRVSKIIALNSDGEAKRYAQNTSAKITLNR